MLWTLTCKPEALHLKTVVSGGRGGAVNGFKELHKPPTLYTICVYFSGEGFWLSPDSEMRGLGKRRTMCQDSSRPRQRPPRARSREVVKGK